MNKRLFTFTNSHDGIERMDLRVNHRLSVDDLAIYASIYIDPYDLVDDEVARPVGDDQIPVVGDIDARVRRMLPNKRSVVTAVTHTLFADGEEKPHYVLGDDHLGNVVEAVKRRVIELWN